jgi:sugar/nucleoside kinase (ribokinase family)
MIKVLGIGNALVDVIYFMEHDGLLSTFGLPKGSMQLVDADQAERVESAAVSFKKHRTSGGSAANTLHGLAKLGMETAFIGTVGRDDLGEFFSKDLQDARINPLLSPGTTATGRAISLVSPGGERTFATYLGAALEITSDQVRNSFSRDYGHLHLEGYLVTDQDLVETALELALRSGMSVSLDLASYNVVEAHLAFVKKIIGEYRPLVFANEEEARVFTGQPDPRKALQVLSSVCHTAVVKIGSKGSLIYHQGQFFSTGAIPVQCIDTTGAGDLYAAGYLYGYLQGLSPEQCGKIGSVLAGKVIEEPGAKIRAAEWDKIRDTLKGDIL